MDDIAKVSGLPEMRRKSLGHPLNMRAAADKYAAECGVPYEKMNLIIAHLGGGITISYHQQGRMIDMVSDEEGPFSPERTGGLPLFQVLEMATDGPGLQDPLQVCENQGRPDGASGYQRRPHRGKMIAEGDRHAALIYEAMAHNISKFIGGLATVARGKVDAIIITGIAPLQNVHRLDRGGSPSSRP